MQTPKTNQVHTAKSYKKHITNNQIPIKNKKTTRLQTLIQKIQKKPQTHNPKYHNKNNKNKLPPSAQTHINYRNANILLHNHHKINLAHKATKTRQPLPKQYQKTKQNYRHTRPNNKTLKTPHMINLNRARPTGLALKKKQ